MIRRQLIIEWNDEGADTDEECRDQFLEGNWTVQDLMELDKYEKAGYPTPWPADLKVWVWDAPKSETVYHIRTDYDGRQSEVVHVYGLDGMRRPATFSNEQDALEATRIMSKIITGSNYNGAEVFSEPSQSGQGTINREQQCC